MSNYHNFVSDFPKRCDDLLTAFSEKAKLQDREVTLMLAVATTGLVIPFERLSSSGKAPSQKCPACGKELPGRSPTPHPARDRDRYKLAVKRFGDLLAIPFAGSQLSKGLRSEDWSFAKKVENENRELDSWPELQVENRRPLLQVEQTTNHKVLKHFRNALAHGNIFTLAKRGQIDLIVLLSKAQDAKKYSMVAVTPTGFHQFLRNWFALLRELPMPDGLFDEQHAA